MNELFWVFVGLVVLIGLCDIFSFWRRLYPNKFPESPKPCPPPEKREIPSPKDVLLTSIEWSPQDKAKIKTRKFKKGFRMVKMYRHNLTFISYVDSWYSVERQVYSRITLDLPLGMTYHEFMKRGLG